MDVNEWNPFEEEEDVLFGKEFDKLRRGSNSSKFNCYVLPVLIENL